MDYQTNLPLKDFYHFDGFKPSGSFVTKDAVQIKLKRTRRTGRCPACAKQRRKVEDYYERKIRDLNILGRKCYVYFTQYRIKCSCSYRGVEQLEFVDKYSLYSTRFEEYVARLCRMMALTDVAKVCEIDWRTTKDIDKKYLSKLVTDLSSVVPRKIGVDEIAYQKRHKYLTVVRDVDSRRVIWVGINRKKETLNLFFTELGVEKCKKIEAAVVDMWDAYIASIKERIPQADIVFDKFHVCKKANEAVDKVRKQEFKKACKEVQKRMKRKRFLILRRGGTLSKSQKEDLKTMMGNNKTLYKTYLLKEQLQDIMDETNEKEAINRLKQWMENVKNAKITALTRLLNTIQNYLYGVLNYFKHRITNAASEAFNNKINLIKRRAYGFRDIGYFKLKILQACGGSSTQNM